jgi:hypothetical protein
MTRLCHRILIVLTVALLPACTSWQPVAHPLPLDSTLSVAGKIRLTDANGVRHRTMYGASAVGANVRFRRPDWSIDSIPLASVVRIERETDDLGASLGVLALLGFAGLVVLGIAVGGSMW